MIKSLDESLARPCAATYEIARQFWRKDAGFTISALGFTGDLVALFFGGLIKKAVATFYSYNPQPADPYIFNLRNVPRCRMLTDINDVLGSLVGSGGAADVAAGAREVVILIDHSPFRLVERVPYVTCPGMKITAVVTTRGLLEKRDGELVLTGYFPTAGEDEEAAIAAITENCGWDLKAADDLKKMDPPTLDELRSARIFDPHSFFLGA